MRCRRGARRRWYEGFDVSLPCFELFQRQERDYRRAVLGVAPRVAAEAAIRDSWDRFCVRKTFHRHGGLRRLRARARSLPALGVTAEAIAVTARRLVGRAPPAPRTARPERAVSVDDMDTMARTVRGKDRYRAGVLDIVRWAIGARLEPKDTDVIACFRVTPQAGVDPVEASAAVAGGPPPRPGRWCGRID